jgi:hypothetical protein
MIITYVTLRKCIGWLGVLLVPVLILGTLLLGPPPAIQTSVSAYYYTNMRNPLEGILSAIGLFLMCYHGYNKQDSIISKLAGVFCVSIGFFPTSDSQTKTDLISTLHYVFAGIFFALLAYMSTFLFTKSSGQMTSQKIKRNCVYRVCGIVMAAAILGVPFDNHPDITFLKPTLVLEAIALTAFGISWLTKGELILKDKGYATPKHNGGPPATSPII